MVLLGNALYYSSIIFQLFFPEVKFLEFSDKALLGVLHAVFRGNHLTVSVLPHFLINYKDMYIFFIEISYFPYLCISKH